MIKICHLVAILFSNSGIFINFINLSLHVRWGLTYWIRAKVNGGQEDFTTYLEMNYKRKTIETSIIFKKDWVLIFFVV